MVEEPVQRSGISMTSLGNQVLWEYKICVRLQWVRLPECEGAAGSKDPLKPLLDAWNIRSPFLLNI